jgi:RNAse (barnase) inhibitor barstar
MKYAIKIHKISTVDELSDTWNVEDFKVLLERFDFANNEVNNLKELRELLFMAIADKDPSEAAAIVLDYRLSDHLNEGQIDSLSYEMLVDKISEEYPKIGLHKELFNVNQLLYKAFNGKFPNTKATIVDFEIAPFLHADKEITKEIVLKCFAENLDPHNIIIRLFGKQLNAEESFVEANDIIWDLQSTETGYRFITSEYFMSKDEFLNEEMDCKIDLFEEA